MSEKLDRFTKRARVVLTLAKEEANRLQHRQIDTEHLLLGLLAEKEGLATRVLVELGCDRSVIQRRVEERVAGPQPARWPWDKGRARCYANWRMVARIAPLPRRW